VEKGLLTYLTKTDQFTAKNSFLKFNFGGIGSLSRQSTHTLTHTHTHTHTHAHAHAHAHARTHTNTHTHTP
jgi:hypothetical protein